MKEMRAAPGTVLAAMPDLGDANFAHKALVIVEHSQEGAYGVVFNQPIDLMVGDLFAGHGVLKESEQQVFWGGPVGETEVQILHRVPEEIPGGRELGGGIFLGGDLEAFARISAAEPERVATLTRVCLGYSGWGAGQLDQELLTGSWLPALLDPEVLFGPGDESAWRRVIRSIDGMGGHSRQPPDPSWN